MRFCHTEYEAGDSLRNKLKGGFGGVNLLLQANTNAMANPFANMAASLVAEPQPGLAPQDRHLQPAPAQTNPLAQKFPGGFPGLGKSVFPGAAGGFNSFQGLSAAMFQTANEIKKLPDEVKKNDPSLNQVSNSTVFANEDVLRNSLHNSISSKINLDQSGSDGADRIICSNTELIISTKNKVCLYSFDRVAGVFAFSKTILGSLR